MAVRQGRLSLKKMIELYESGMDTAEIAEQNGYKNDKFIVHKLREAGYVVRRNIDTGKVMALHRAGWSNQDIAWDMSIPIEKVEGVLNDRD